MSLSRLSRLPLLLLLLAAALAVAGCGNKEDHVSEADSEGIYVDVGDLAYQVQISRALNPGDVEDRGYLAGIPTEDQELGRDETWFGVFVRVENNGDEAKPSAEEFEVVDTQEQVYEPIDLAETNPFAYRPAVLEPEEEIPGQDTAASETPINGGLVLFKVKNFTLQNRPLELRIKSALSPTEEGVVDMDV